MSITSDEVAELHAAVRELSDRAEITRLCDRYTLHLDRDRDTDDWLGSVFTQDARLTFPFGTFDGIRGLADFQELARKTFARTHHLSANYDIVLGDDEARVRAHLMAVHVARPQDPATHFTIGGHYEALAVRTAAGWRFREFRFDLAWQAGEGPAGDAHP